MNMEKKTLTVIAIIILILSIPTFVSAEEDGKTQRLSSSEPNQPTPAGKISAKRLKEMKGDWTGSFVGIGVAIKSVDKGLLIENILSDSTKEAGLKIGQIITAVETTKTTDISLGEAINLIKGPEGTAVNLQILSPDGKTETVSVIRKKNCPHGCYQQNYSG